MCNNNNRTAVRRHGAQIVKKLGGLLRSKHCSGLIQHQHLGIAIQYLYYFHHLLLAYGQLPYPCRRLNFHIVFLCTLRNTALHLAPVIKERQIVIAHYNVFRNGKGVYQLEMLMYHAYAAVDSILRAGKMHLLSVHIYLAGIRLIQPGQYIHKGGFTRAVFSQQRMYFSRLYIEGYIVVCNIIGEYLGYPLHLYNRFSLLHMPPSIIILPHRPYIPASACGFDSLTKKQVPVSAFAAYPAASSNNKNTFTHKIQQIE